MENNVRQIVRPAIWEAIYRAVDAEIARAQAKHPPIHSGHEAYAVIAEELDGFRAAVWLCGSSTRPNPAEARMMRAELFQVAATAVRAAIDLGLCHGWADEQP